MGGGVCWGGCVLGGLWLTDAAVLSLVCACRGRVVLVWWCASSTSWAKVSSGCMVSPSSLPTLLLLTIFLGTRAPLPPLMGPPTLPLPPPPPPPPPPPSLLSLPISPSMTGAVSLPTLSDPSSSPACCCVASVHSEARRKLCDVASLSWGLPDLGAAVHKVSMQVLLCVRMCVCECV